MNEPATLVNVAVSLYQNSFDRVGATSNLCEIMDGIKSGKWQKQVEAIRNEKDKTKRSKLKQKIPAFTAGGLFTSRNVNGLISHSGRLAIDFDLQDNPALGRGLEAVRKLLCEDKFSEYVSLSVSGQGLFAIVRIDGNKTCESFAYLEQYYKETYGLVIDKSCKDVSRLRFMSFDPHIYCNEKAEILVLPKADSEAKKERTTAGNGDSTRNWEFVEALIRSGILIGDDSYNSWIRIGLALATEFGEAGRDFFHGLSRPSSKYSHAVCDKKYTELLGSKNGDVTFGTIVHLSKEAGFKYHEPELLEEEIPKKKKKKKFEPVDFGAFWMTDEAGNVELCQGMLLDFLKQSGFQRYQPSAKDPEYVYVKIQDNVVKEIQRHHLFLVKDFVIGYLKKMIGEG